MCRHFDPTVLGQCREEDAEEVLDKRKVNFCEWFLASPDAFDGQANAADDAAKLALAALFGDTRASGEEQTQPSGTDDAPDPLSDAEDLFR